MVGPMCPGVQRSLERAQEVELGEKKLGVVAPIHRWINRGQGRCREMSNITQRAGHCAGLLVANRNPGDLAGLWLRAAGGARSCEGPGACGQPSPRPPWWRQSEASISTLAGGAFGTCPGNRDARAAAGLGAGAACPWSPGPPGWRRRGASAGGCGPSSWRYGGRETRE